MEVVKATFNDLSEILELQKLCYHENALRYNNFNIAPITQTIEEIESDFTSSTFLKIVDQSKLIASIRCNESNDTCYIGRVIVHPKYQNMGIGKQLIRTVEQESQAKRFELFTGNRDQKNLHLYKKLGYHSFKEERISELLSLIYLEKQYIKRPTRLNKD